MITCKSGVTIRTSIVDIREAGRATQGVKLIRLDEEDDIAATSIIGDQGEEDANASDEEGNLPSSDGEAQPSDEEPQNTDDSQTNTPAE
jgi:DNA gyrase subunit A